MWRSIAVAAALGMGCTQLEVADEAGDWRSEQRAPERGAGNLTADALQTFGERVGSAWVQSDGSRIQLGMDGLTCSFDPYSGENLTDEDVDEWGEDIVLDAIGEDSALVGVDGADSVFTVDAETGDTDLEGSWRAWLGADTDLGFALVTEDCWGVLGSHGAVHTVQLPAELCDAARGSLAGASSGHAWLAAGTVHGFSATGATPLEWRGQAVRGDLIAWDSYAGLLYVAQSDRNWIRALRPSGDQAWWQELSAPIWDLALADDGGVLVALTGDGDDLVLEALEAGTGARMGRAEVGDEVRRIDVSADGTVAVALLTSGAVQTFALSH